MFKKQTFTFVNEKGVEENIALERWGWGVVYTDGSELHQFGADGVFHQFKEIDQSRISIFSLYLIGDMETSIHIPMQEGMQIFHFYRNIRPHYDSKFHKVYVIGYKHDGKIVHHFVLPNDSIVTSPIDNIDLPQFKLI